MSMDMLVAPKPLFNQNIEVEGYYLACQTGNILLENAKVANKLDGCTNSAFLDFVSSVGLDALTMGKLVFVPTSDILLLMDLENSCTVDHSMVVLVLDKKFKQSELNLERIRHFRRHGFKIAFTNVVDFSNMDLFMAEADYVFINLPFHRLKILLGFMKNKFPNINFVVTDIHTQEAFEEMRYSGISMFDGSFYKLPLSSASGAVSPLKVNLIQILNVINNDDFELSKFASIVQRDPALAVKFLRMANSSRMISSKIKSINHAAAMLGQKEIKKWITTAVNSTLCEDKPSELTRISLIRATFCENLATLFGLAIFKESLFLLGLFSVLDVILEVPIEQALDLVLVPDGIREALVNKRGELYEIYSFIINYEHAEWLEVSRVALVKGFSIDDINHAYLEALIWYSKVVNAELEPDQ